MEEVNETGETLTIKEPPRKSEGEKKFELIPEGVYEAEYTGLKTVAYTDPKYGPKKKARLHFRIVSGPNTDRKTSFSGNLHRNKETGEFYVGADSDLAKAIKVITRGSMALDDSHKGAQVLIEITHQQSKDKTKTWDFATNVMKKADTGPAPAKAAAPAAQPAAAQPTSAPAPAKAPESELLSELTELGDFKL